MQQNKLVYLDGLKGFGCVCVFLTHFVFAFYYGMYHYQLEACHLPDNLDIVIGKSPLKLTTNGFLKKLSVCQKNLLKCGA